MKIVYFTEPVPDSQPTYLMVSKPLNLSEPLPEDEFNQLVSRVSSDTIIGKVTVRRTLGNGILPSLLVLDGLQALRLNRVAALSELGYDSILSPADKSIHPFSKAAEYDPGDNVRLSEFAQAAGYLPVWRVMLNQQMGYDVPIQSATASTVATGALSSSATEQPPGTQALLAGDQDSTANVSSPGVTPLTSNPSTNLGSSIVSDPTSNALPTSPTLKLGEKHWQTGRTVVHATDDLDELMKLAKLHLPTVIDVLSRAAGSVPGVKFIPPGNGEKGMARLQTNAERLRSKLANGRVPSNLSDLIGARLWVDDVGSIPDVVNAITQMAGAPIADDDFSTGVGRNGYRARHLQVPIPNSPLSMELQIMPREIGEVHDEAAKAYEKFQEPVASLSEVLAARDAVSQLFGGAQRRYVRRILGQSPEAPITSPSASYLNTQAPVEIEDAVPEQLGVKLKELGVSASSVGEAYRLAHNKLKASEGDGAREKLHQIMRENGVDAVRYKRGDGKMAWIPMGEDQLYNAATVKMSEFAVKNGFIPVDSECVEVVQLNEPTPAIEEGYFVAKNGRSYPYKVSRWDRKERDPETGLEPAYGFDVYVSHPDFPKLGGGVGARVRDGSGHTENHNLPVELQGIGLGSLAMEALLRNLKSSGARQLVSDPSVSPEASRVYDAMKKRGYVVRQNGGEFTIQLSSNVALSATEPIHTGPGADGGSTPLSAKKTSIIKPKEGGKTAILDEEPKRGVQSILESARKWVESQGRQYEPYDAYDDVDEDWAKKAADYEDQAQHNPADPAVQKSYAQLAKDVASQFQFAQEHDGVKFEPWPHQDSQPYANSEEMINDVKNNKHLYFFTGGNMPEDHPLAQKTESGLTYNDMFRAVHDYYGHAMRGNQFGPRGEENAWLQHSRMFNPDAVPAMTAETKMQNNWVNFGKQLRREDGSIPGKTDPDYVPPAKRAFASQKAYVPPDDFLDFNHYRKASSAKPEAPATPSLPDAGQKQPMGDPVKDPRRQTRR